jgi:hypothetical protein
LQLKKMGEAAFHLPLGGLTTPEGEKAMREFDKEKGEGAVQKAVSKYLDFQLEEAVSRGKPLVLIDYASTGGSLVVTADFIKAWLKSKKSNLDVLIFGYSEKNLDKLPKLASGQHEGTVATASGRMEKAFTKMNADKIFKKVLLLRGPASLEIGALLGPNPAAALVQNPDHWARVLRLMRKEIK